VKGKTARSRSQFQDIYRLAEVKRRSIGMTISNESCDNLDIGVGYEGIAGDVMRYYALTPGFDSLLFEEMPLQFPEDRTGKALVPFDNEALFCLW